jgi:CO/xanthine dehydrogenase FAD-binding subunit
MGVLTPPTLEDAVAALAAHPDALVLAGGTDVMVEVNEAWRRLGDGTTVVAVGRLPELRTWVHDPATRTLTIGAGVTYAELTVEPLAGLVPAMAQAARTVGSPQIRNAATLGGNLATCSPAGDGLPVLSALDAVVHVAGPQGGRAQAVHEFMVGVKRTTLAPGELITAVSVPVLDGWQGYAKVGVRNAMVIAIAGVCVAVDRPGRSVRIALGSVAPTIVRARQAEQLAGEAVDWAAGTLDSAVIARVASLAAGASSPIDDHRSTAAYRRRAVEVLTARQLHRAFGAA